MAYMMVFSSGSPTEVEEILSKAPTEVGETAVLIDTRGTPHLRTGLLREAVADLEWAVDQEPTASRCVHWAPAYQPEGRAEGATHSGWSGEFKGRGGAGAAGWFCRRRSLVC